MRSRQLLAAARLVCALSALVFAWTLRRATLRIPVLDAAASNRTVSHAAISRPQDQRHGLVASTIDQDPFQPTRKRPPERFLLPGEALPQEATATKSVIEGDSLRLVGTALVGRDGGFAICRRGIGAPMLVHIGKTVDSMTLIQLQPGRAVFRSVTGKHIELHMPKGDT
jgi:hypothetical protein